MNEKQCPYCKEWIPEELSFCPYCMNRLTGKKKPGMELKNRNGKLLVVAVLLIVLGLMAVLVWDFIGKEKKAAVSEKNTGTENREPYADYMGLWNGETSPYTVELKIEEVKDRKLYAYVTVKQGENDEILRTYFNGEIQDDGCVMASYDTGNEKGRIRLELQIDQIEFSAYQTEAEEWNLWTTGRIPIVYLERQ